MVSSDVSAAGAAWSVTAGYGWSAATMSLRHSNCTCNLRTRFATALSVETAQTSSAHVARPHTCVMWSNLQLGSTSGSSHLIMRSEDCLSRRSTHARDVPVQCYIVPVPGDAHLSDATTVDRPRLSDPTTRRHRACWTRASPTPDACACGALRVASRRSTIWVLEVETGSVGHENQPNCQCVGIY